MMGRIDNVFARHLGMALEFYCVFVVATIGEWFLYDP